MKSDKVLEHLNYIQKRIFKGFALYLTSNTLSNETHQQLNTLLIPLVQEKKALLFPLKNKDIVLFFNNNKAPVLMDLMFQLKNKYPLLKQHSFDLKKQFDALFKMIYDIQIFPSQKQALKVLKKIPKEQLTLEILDILLNQLTPAYLLENLPIQNGCLKLDLTYLRQKLFPNIDLNSNPELTEILYRQLTKRLSYTADLFYPICVCDLSDETPNKIILRLSDILTHFSHYQAFRHTHPETRIFIEKDITAPAINEHKLKDCFVSFL